MKKRLRFYHWKTFKDNAPMAAFMLFAVYVLYKMERQLDGMRRKIYSQKSIKEMEIERENEVSRMAPSISSVG